MVQSIFKWYLMMSMSYNDEYGSNDIQVTSDNGYEI